MAKMTALMAKMAGRMEKGEFATMPEMDSKELAQLLEACKNGQLTAMLGNMPGMGGDMPGHGFGAHGHDSTPIKDTGATHPRLVAMGKAAPLKGTGKSGSAAELAKYMAKQQGPPKHLPNGKVVGSRTANGQELQTVVTGDPGAATANTPYFQVYGSGKKQAESTLDKENIPATYKQQVRRYFESIRP
jgi:hypothetical protein